jgi:Uma2 family endonuclease
MVTARAYALPPDPRRVDQRVVLHDVTWQAYEALLACRGDWGGVRMTYLEGALELMTPSIDHEDDKKKLARLAEAWAEEMDIRLEGAGSWTIKKQAVDRGAEPDECYVVGVRTLRGITAPDIAIEVIWTSGGIDKLEVYRKLGVREVWIWEVDRLSFHLLRGEAYVPATRSEILPDLDPELVARCLAIPSQVDAVKALRTALRAKRRASAKRRSRGRASKPRR